MRPAACLILAAAAALWLVACDLDVIQNHHVNEPPPVVVAPPGEPTPAPVTGFACVRIEGSDGLASAARCTWTGGTGPYDILAVRASDGLESLHPSQVSPATINPGPPATGAGTWVVTLRDGATVLGTSTVVLDS